MISSRSVDDLHPVVRNLALYHRKECDKIGIDLLIYCTYRDNEAQDELYKIGRTKPGKIITNARGGQSAHNYKVAYDCVPCVSGKPQWDDVHAYMLVGSIGKTLGLEWAYEWKTFKEMPHFQYLGGLTLQDLQAGKQIPSTVYAINK